MSIPVGEKSRPPLTHDCSPAPIDCRTFHYIFPHSVAIQVSNHMYIRTRILSYEHYRRTVVSG
jgi:hypothetical protein